jgi:hypothetical protein
MVVRAGSRRYAAHVTRRELQVLAAIKYGGSPFEEVLSSCNLHGERLVWP